MIAIRSSPRATRRLVDLVVLPLVLAASCAPRPSRPAPPSPSASRPAFEEVFPHVRIDRALALVEFDAVVALNFHDPETPDTFLEQIVCLPDTKEHESLVVSRARASEIHAALLLAGLTPGHPGSWRLEDQRLVPIEPTGTPLHIEFVHRDANGQEVSSDPLAWAIDATRGRTLRSHMESRFPGQPAFVFAGSRFVSYNGPEVYDADLAGTVVGLTTFGGETIALREVISHESAIQPPEWLAHNERIPPADTPVRVRVRPAR